MNCDSVVFTVGHPTRWNSLDIAIYKAILRRSVLGGDDYEGMKAELIVAAESRAAFLYLKSQQISVGLKPGESALLIDIGSSTIDVTAMSVSSKNHEFNYGSNYLGARSIDYMLREFYLSNLKKNSADWEEYQHLLRNNPSLESALTLACRMAKERVFSGSNGTDRIYFLEYKPVKMPINVIPICMVDKNLSGSLASFKAVAADLFPRFISVSKRVFRAETKAISDIDSIPLNKIRPIIMTISIKYKVKFDFAAKIINSSIYQTNGLSPLLTHGQKNKQNPCDFERKAYFCKQK